MGCSGGQLPKAWNYLKTTGIVADACFPYSAGGGHAPACPSKCVDAESWSQSKTKASTAYAINGVTNMQKDIMTNGPIQVAFKVYKSFCESTHSGHVLCSVQACGLGRLLFELVGT